MMPKPDRIQHDEVWVTHDGQRIEVQDLDLKHAHNILRMLLREQRQTMLERLGHFLNRNRDFRG